MQLKITLKSNMSCNSMQLGQPAALSHFSSDVMGFMSDVSLTAAHVSGSEPEWLHSACPKYMAHLLSIWWL